MAKKSKTNSEGFSKKWAQFLPEGFMEEAVGFSEEQLRSTIIQANTSIAEQEKLRDEDSTLKAAKDTLKDLSGAYKDSIKCQTAKIKYSLFVLETTGKI